MPRLYLSWLLSKASDRKEDADPWLDKVCVLPLSFDLTLIHSKIFSCGRFCFLLEISFDSFEVMLPTLSLPWLNPLVITTELFNELRPDPMFRFFFDFLPPFFAGWEIYSSSLFESYSVISRSSSGLLPLSGVEWRLLVVRGKFWVAEVVGCSFLLRHMASAQVRSSERVDLRMFLLIDILRRFYCRRNSKCSSVSWSLE